LNADHEHARFVDTVQKEHEQFVGNLKRNFEDRLRTSEDHLRKLQTERDELAETLARVRMERNASRRSYLHYRSIVQHDTERRRQRMDRQVLLRSTFPGSVPAETSDLPSPIISDGE
jgi:hypothetical protein